ncbi:hypothetical protein BN1088_1432306 [Sphingobacterium sp. PM2-P1-29]|nr:hypothetical protein BN1088_1432306 [Sphingobacterium sp. PM2-P1-29]
MYPLILKYNALLLHQLQIAINNKWSGLEHETILFKLSKQMWIVADHFSSYSSYLF